MRFLYYFTIIFNIMTVFSISYLYRNDRNFWRRQGCIYASADLYKSISLDFYSKNQKEIDKAIDVAVKMCIDEY